MTTLFREDSSIKLPSTRGYYNEGNEFDMSKADTSGTLLIYLYKNQKTSTYFYTFQVPSDITPNYPDLVADGIAFYTFTSEIKPTDAIPIHRFWNEGRSAEVGSPVHFFPSTKSNKQNVIDNSLLLNMRELVSMLILLIYLQFKAECYSGFPAGVVEAVGNFVSMPQH